MTTEPDRLAAHDGPGGAPLGVLGIVVTTLVLFATTSALVVALVVMWPATTVDGAAPAATGLARDQQMFVVIAISGALGGLIHALRSLYWYVGNRAFRRSWLLMYVCTPLVGAVLALVFYIVVRGGLLSGQTASEAVNPFGFCAVAALVGLFSSQAVQKLKEVFSTLFAPAEPGLDQVPATKEG